MSYCKPSLGTIELRALMCRPSAKLPSHYTSVIAKTLSKLRTGSRHGVGSYSWAITPGDPAARGGSGRLDPARHAQACTQLARKAPALRTYIIRLRMAAFAMFSASRADRNRINIRSELIDGVREGNSQITL